MLGVYLDNKVEGVISFGNPVASRAHKAVKNTVGKQVLELTRLWLSDRLGKNSESRVIAIALRLIKKKRRDIQWIISYADPNHGHLGTIYQATNWTYIGLTTKTEYYVLPNGKKKHTKTLNDIVKSRKNLMKIFGNKIRIERTSGKHCYIYFLNESYRKYLIKPIRAYPKIKNRESSMISTPYSSNREAIVKPNRLAPPLSSLSNLARKVTK